jgi:methionyl-tRNA formyltransferase
MNIFICGQKSFGLAVAKRLLADGHKIVGVAPPPQQKYKDKVVGWAMLKHIPIVDDCERLVSEHIPDGTDLIVSAHSHWIINDKVISRCRYGGIGYHPSLLPRHRGRDAVRWAVAMGDPITGGTIYRLDDKCDGGDILLQRVQFIGREWDYHELWRRLFQQGVDMVSEACALIERTSNTQPERKQDEEFATWEPSWERQRLPRTELPQLCFGEVDATKYTRVGW